MTNVPLKLAGFVGVLGVAFGGAFAVGTVLDPTQAPPAPSAEHGGHNGETDTAGAGADTAGTDSGLAPNAEGAYSAAGGQPLSGLATSQDGFTLVPESTSVAAGATTPFRFQVVGPDGQPVRDGYEVEAERELHFVVVRRDTATFQHVHPVRDHDGTWSTPLALTDPGAYRAFADFTVGGQRRVLATDLFVAGEFQPVPWPQPAASAEVDGFTVSLTTVSLTTGTPATSALRAADSSGLTFQVARDGQAVTGLQPYLGEKGHLVVLHEGDLGYLHAHPDSVTAPEGEIRFVAEFPSVGRYRLFLEFSVDGTVRVASWTVEVGR